MKQTGEVYQPKSAKGNARKGDFGITTCVNTKGLKRVAWYKI